MPLVFSDEIKNLYKGQMNVYLVEIEKHAMEFENRFSSKLISQKNRPERLLGHNGMAFLLKLLTRTLHIIDGTIVSINNSNTTMAFLGVRAQIETTGAISCLHKWLTKFYNKECTYDELDERLKRLFLGIKTFPHENSSNPNGKLEPISVMTLIDDIDSACKKIGIKQKKPFRGIYNFLSEFCHPNFFGISIASSVNEKGVLDYQYPPKINQNELDEIAFSLAFSSKLFLMLYDECFNSLTKNEETPILEKRNN